MAAILITIIFLKKMIQKVNKFIFILLDKLRLTHRLTLHDSKNELNFGGVGLSKGKISKREQIESKEKTKELLENNNNGNNGNYNGKNSPTNNFTGVENNNSTNFTSNNSNNHNVAPEPVIKKKWIRKISFKSQAGKNETGNYKTNQDSYLIMDNILNNEEFKIFGVLDGHGK